jgi:hypothetical protein
VAPKAGAVWSLINGIIPTIIHEKSFEQTPVLCLAETTIE